jgi:uncharacterized DUF497 family protein
MRFEWDSRKARGNTRKHGVTFDEAMTVFSDPFALTFADHAHAHGEHRFLTLGASSKGRLLVVSHVDRAATLRILQRAA